MKYDVKAKCENCGKVFVLHECLAFEFPDDPDYIKPTKEELEELDFVERPIGKYRFCEKCREIQMTDKFTYAGKLKDWQNWKNDLPQAKGVYAVVYKDSAMPEFNKVGRGGHFKDKDPNVDIKDLQEKWNRSHHEVLYIGRANNLSQRVKQYMRFGEGKPVSHWGGRYIWQMKDCGELEIHYMPCENPQSKERELIAKYKPFANLKNGDNE